MDYNPLQALMDGMNAQWMEERSKTQMTFGELIDRLKELPQNTRIEVADVDSYRGYYSDIALEPYDSSLAGELLQRCENMLGDIMEGYKGGEYPIHRNVPVWISNYGEASGIKLIAINDDGTLITEEEE